MTFNAFEVIRDSLMEELRQQGFGEPVSVEEEGGRFEMTVAADIAYGLKYDKKRQQFELRSTTLDEDQKPTKWRSLSVWLFDENEGTRSDAESISNDFLEVVRGPKRVAVVKKKKNKDEDRNVDPAFFFNRLVGIFPEIRDEINEERILYGQVRPVTFAKEKVLPKCEDLAKKYKDSSTMQKLCELFNDMYADGDLDLRSVLTISIMNGMSEEAFLAMKDKLSDELQLDTKYTRKLIGKKIKPEKKKKEKKVVARLDGKR